MRCFDCFDEITDCFAVLKKLRDLPPETDPVDAKHLEALTYDQVFVCGACAPWYGDHAIHVPQENEA